MARNKSQQKRPQQSGRRNPQAEAKIRRAKLVRETHRVIANTQRMFTYDTLRCATRVVAELAETLVDMAEDLHCGLGIWKAYEQHNAELFGTPLPLTLAEVDAPNGALNAERFHHFLWVMYPQLIDGLMISPGHQDLRLMANACSRFLSEAFLTMPKTSERLEFLQSPNNRGWDVKRKLVWLGSHSYLFRRMFADYIQAEGVPATDIPTTDDFICMQCTQWSGMTAIDVLSRVLTVSPDDVADLANWYERHAAFYQIVTPGREVIRAINVINGQPYTIRMDADNPFREGMMVFGSLVPWRGEWYWSGQQSTFDDADRMDVSEMKEQMKRQNSKIVCRYDLAYRELVFDRITNIHADALAYYGTDLVLFPDGLAMAAAFEQELKHQWESKSQEDAPKVIEKYGLNDGRANLNFPRDISEHTDGIGVFLNPVAGKELMIHFTSLVAALTRTDGELSDDEENAVRGFMTSETVSDAFVRRVLSEYGDAIVRKVFLLKSEVSAYWLHYLLRRHKGLCFKNRYPAISVV